MSDKKYISKIHGKYYDLKSFNHPGGSTALWHSYGRDSTVLFESHHPLVSKDKLEIILKKYEIPVPENFLIKDE
jgi:delta11-fatty-acid desaturase